VKDQALGELAAAVLETVARFLPPEPPMIQPVLRAPPQVRVTTPDVLAVGAVVRFQHKSFGTEMLGRIVGFRKPDRLVLRPTAMRWGSGWQKVTYTRTIVIPASKVVI